MKYNNLLKSVDDIIDTQFIPAITDGHYCSPDERLLLALPVKMGGLGIPILSQISKLQNKNSINHSAALPQKIIHQDMYSRINLKEQNNIRNNITNQHEDIQKHKLEELPSQNAKRIETSK